jgi:thiol-disulfide isomerase/thioredoxin
MKRLLIPLIVIIGLAAASSVIGAPILKVGDKAPAIKVGKWVKGDAITKLDPAKAYVIEFWATWCGPCKQSIPHLTELAKKYKGKVTFAGISVWEHGGDVAAFVKSMGDKMNYSVATDASNEYMANAWMAAAGEHGIPCAFVVGKGNKVLWIGHPMGDLDKVLGQVVEGKYDAKAFGEQRAKDQALEQKRNELATEIEGMMKQGKSKEALDKLDKYLATDTDFEEDVADVRVKLLYATDETAGYAYVRKLAEGPFKDNPYALTWLAGSVIDTTYKLKSPDYDLAVSLGTRAVELSKAQDAYILSKMADVYDRKGNIDKAIESQESAVKIASGDKEWPKDAVDQLKTRLQELKDKKK